MTKLMSQIDRQFPKFLRNTPISYLSLKYESNKKKQLMFSRFSKNPIPTNYMILKYKLVENDIAKHVNPKLNKPYFKDFRKPYTFINQE